MTDPTNPLPTTDTPDKLEAVAQELITAIESDDVSLKSCLKRLELEARSCYKKDPLPQIVARIGSVSASRDNPFAVFNRAISLSDTSLSPNTIIRGLLLRESSGPPDELLTQVFVWSLVQPSGKDSIPGETSLNSPVLLSHLKRQLGEHFPSLGLTIWNRAAERTNHAEWCESWASFTRAVLQLSADLPKSIQRELSDRYAEKLSQAEAGPARKLVPLLLFLADQIGPFGDTVASSIRMSPVGKILLRQTQELLGFPPSQSNCSPQVREWESDSKEFEGLPEPLELAMRSILSYLRLLHSSQNTLNQELAFVRTERDSLREQLNQVNEKLLKRTEDLDRLGNEIATVQGQRDAERTRAEEIQQASAEIRRELAETMAANNSLQKGILSGKEDYDRLHSRSQQEIGQVRQHVLSELHSELREVWQIMGRMLEMVIRGERNVNHLATVWNQLDAILSNKLGKAGHPINSISP